MDIDYDWRFSVPGDRLNVHLMNFRDGQQVFDATLSLSRTPLNRENMTRMMLLYPAMTVNAVSQQQYDDAKHKIVSAGLSRRTHLLKSDYRELTGQYDKLVSIEMIEAVGHQYYNTFFSNCARYLKDDGLMAIQAITIADHAFDQHRRDVDFIKRYIFPGSCLPSVTALLAAMSTASDLHLFHLEDITPALRHHAAHVAGAFFR